MIIGLDIGRNEDKKLENLKSIAVGGDVQL